MNPNITPYWRQNNMYNGIEENAPIYKFMPLNYVLLMVQNNLLTINRISSWPDVYENYMLKQQYQLQDGTPVGVVHQTDGVYGQCWTLCPETDAMWRIYSPNMDAVRIRTTVSKLYDALYLSDHNMADTFIGKVRYRPQADIENEVQSLSPLSPGQFIKEVARRAFDKRLEFSHEDEVRIVKILDSAAAAASNALIQFPIGADFIEEFCIDPRADTALASNIQNSLMGIGVQAGLIVQSPLYQFTAHQIVFD